MESKVCSRCGEKFEFQPSANIIIFCPKCRKQTFMECEYGFGPVTPCDIMLGGERIALVTNENGKFIFTSKRFNVCKDLEKVYLEALQEAAKLTEELLAGEEK